MTLDEDGDSLSAIEFEVRGIFATPHNGYEINSVLHLWDVTDVNAPLPILGFVPQLQEQATRAFQFVGGPSSAYEVTHIEDWMSFCRIPIDFLIFPQRGDRRIVARLTIASASDPPVFEYGQLAFGSRENQRLAEVDSVPWAGLTAGYGYMEEAEDALQAQEATIQLAMYLSMTDDSIERDEVVAIRDWTTKQVMAEGEPDDQLKVRLNDAIRSAHAEAMSGELVFDDIISVLVDRGNAAGQHSALSLATEVMAADGHADARELSLLHTIAEALSVPDAFFKSLLAEKSMLLSTDDDDNSNLILGLTDDMEAHEKRSRLTMLYMQYNSQVTHGDAEIRRNAEKMLMVIAAARRRNL